jgi:hypothetical protein
MKRFAFLVRLAGVLGTVALLALFLTGPVGALPALFQITPEPTPRPTATSAPYIEVNPDHGVVGNDNQTTVTGHFYVPNQPVTFMFDATQMEVLQGPVWNPDNTFTALVRIPPQADAGQHGISAIQGALQASAPYWLENPTATYTPTPTNTPTPSNTPTPRTPTATHTATGTPLPTATLRPITPMVTITPIPPTTAPARTNTPAPTRTNTPVPGTPTNTLTPSSTPTPSDTPGPGTPSATPGKTATPEPETPDTGGGWGAVFLWGFVLAGLLIVFRLLRVSSLRGQG